MLSDKLILLRKKSFKTQLDVANEISVSRASYGSYEQGTRMPDPQMLLKLSDYFNVSVDYLLGRTDQATGTEIDFSRYPNLMQISTKKIPLLGEIACGKPIYANEDRESYVQAGTQLNADFCLIAKGDSMVNARILSGDIVFIRKQNIVENGEIAAVLIGEEVTLKRVYFYKDRGKLILSPENPAFEPLVYEGQELNDIKILGKAIAFQSDVK